MRPSRAIPDGRSIRIRWRIDRRTERGCCHRDWLIGELIGGHFWPRDRDDAAPGRRWAGGASIELRF